jgi:hypothetical protein
MNAGNLQNKAKFLRLALIISIISSILSAYMLLQLNGIVHGQLYSFGLQFDLSWASSYWTLERLIYASLATSTVLNISVLAYVFLRKEKSNAPTPVPTKVEPSRVFNKVQAVKENSMLISCPKCKKLFGKPLNMLDFSQGTTRLVNVCPYCNHILGNASEAEVNDTRVLFPEKKEVTEK